MVACAAWLASATAWGAEYRFIELGTLGGSANHAARVGDGGNVVGHSQLPGDAFHHATRWDHHGMPADVDPDGKRSQAHDINAAGAVVGRRVWFIDGRFQYHATLWQGGVAVDLGALAGGGSGGGDSNAQAINDAGQIAGSSQIETGYPHAAMWLEDGSVVDLGTLPGYIGSHAEAINNAGDVVGWSWNQDGGVRPTLWQNGSISDLGTLGGVSGYAYWMNDASQAVGCSQRSGSDAFHATLWSGGNSTDLSRPAGEQHSCAYGINAYGVAVGTVSLPNRPGPAHKRRRAVRWIGGVMNDLNYLVGKKVREAGWVLVEATSINDEGEIVGEAHNKLTGVAKRAFLLKPRTGARTGE